MGRLGSYSGIALDHRSAQQWHYMIYSGLVSHSLRIMILILTVLSIDTFDSSPSS